jgi:hypothetical protein
VILGGQPKKEILEEDVSAPFFADSKIGPADFEKQAGLILLIIIRGIVLEEGDSAFFLRIHHRKRMIASLWVPIDNPKSQIENRRPEHHSALQKVTNSKSTGSFAGKSVKTL